MFEQFTPLSLGGIPSFCLPSVSHRVYVLAIFLLVFAGRVYVWSQSSHNHVVVLYVCVFACVIAVAPSLVSHSWFLYVCVWMFFPFAWLRSPWNFAASSFQIRGHSSNEFCSFF